ncbi:SulP family inorganic anion transporter [Xylophilus sp. Leaf220]|uniref:SulP family inorganic anion transporter n=1 Tax=Xylophilus sp. Leaf220 TaxID=1735686 RepID=UPI0006FC3546|nr:SulP family inorganic anion transporter [Xylophilus sp. Leaf220]KQM75574.1 sulfate transporter [Xylophilus sp. Leaf220]
MRAILQKRLPFLRWPRPTRELLTNELWAGITVGLLLVPQGVAYASVAGMPLITGIYASLLPALVAVLFSSSSRLGVGPTALSSLLIGASLAGLAPPGSAQWVTLAVWLSLLSGLFQILLGLGRFGWLLNLVSSPVMNGFTQAAAWLIVASQLPALVGASGDFSLLVQHPYVYGEALAYGVGAIALLMTAKRWYSRFPAAIAVVTLSALASRWTGYEARGGSVVGDLPAGLPSLSLPSMIDATTFASLLLPALVITLMSFLETASSARVDHQQAGTRWDENQDLLAQGLGKIASGLSGAFPTSASFSRSAINLYAGARTGYSTIFSVLLVFALLQWFIPVLHHVPQSVLAAVVLTAVFGLIRPSQLNALWRFSRAEACIGWLTFACTLATAPRIHWGVLTGLLLGLGHFLYQRLHPRIIEVGTHADGSLRDRHLWTLPPIAPGVLALRMDAALDFASASTFERAITDHLAAHPQVRHVCVFAQPMNWIDATGVEFFVQILKLLKTRGVALHLSGLKLPVDTTLRRAGVLVESEMLRTYRTDAEAVSALQALAVPPVAGANNPHSA